MQSEKNNVLLTFGVSALYYTACTRIYRHALEGLILRTTRRRERKLAEKKMRTFRVVRISRL